MNREEIFQKACAKYDVYSVPQMRNILQDVPTGWLETTMLGMKTDMDTYASLFRNSVMVSIGG